MFTLPDLKPAELAQLPNEELERIAGTLLAELEQDRKENQLEYYCPVNPEAEVAHYSMAREVGIIGGHRSTKSDTMLSELAIQLTGVVPRSLQDKYPRSKLHPPIRARLFCTSFQNAFEVQLKRKLVWDEWDGLDSERGHWGWIPRRFLLGGKWENSWTEKHRTLRLKNGSVCQVMSYEQDPSDVKVGSFHLICEDELGPEGFHRQNRMRVMETKGQIYTAATPPDDRGQAINAAWFHDQVYLPGLQGLDPSVFAVQIRTERNRLLHPEDIHWLAKGLTEEQRQAQLYGKFLHLAGLIFPEFAEFPRKWCLKCERETYPGSEGLCSYCHSDDVGEFRHVMETEEIPPSWPILFYFDPHPRKPLAGIWVAVDPNDDWWIIDEIEVDPIGGPVAVKQAIEAYATARGWASRVVWKKGDTKMTTQKNEFAGEHWTIGKALRDVGFDFEDANTSRETGYALLRDAMQVNHWTKQPRLHVLDRCRKTIYQMTHFCWAEHSFRRTDRDVREIEQEKNSDFPACLRFMANDQLTWSGLYRLRTGARMHLSVGTGRSTMTGY